MNLSKKKRILLAIILLLIGIIAWIGKERFIGTMVIICSLFLGFNIIGTTVKDRLVSFILGVYFLTGAIICFFYPKLIFVLFASTALAKYFSNFIIVFFAIVGIFMIYKGLKKKRVTFLRS